MKIYLHVHIHRTLWIKYAKSQIPEMVEVAIQERLESLVILDHNYHATGEDCAQAPPGFKLFRGAKVDIFRENVVIVSNTRMDFTPPYRHEMKDLNKLKEYFEKTSALATLAHPYRLMRSRQFRS